MLRARGGRRGCEGGDITFSEHSRRVAKSGRSVQGEVRHPLDRGDDRGHNRRAEKRRLEPAGIDGGGLGLRLSGGHRLMRLLRRLKYK